MARRKVKTATAIITQKRLTEFVELKAKEDDLKEELKDVRKLRTDAEEMLMLDIKSGMAVEEGTRTVTIETKKVRNSVSWKTEYVMESGLRVLTELKAIGANLMIELQRLIGSKKVRKYMRDAGEDVEAAVRRAAGEAEAKQIADSQGIEYKDELVVN